MLPIMEMFYSIQGEGFNTGMPAFFIRLAGCDVGCHWCDVKESWDAGKHEAIEVKKIVQAVVKAKAQTVVITGGEPAMYDLTNLTSALSDKGIYILLETSGAYALKGTFDWVCVSPKKFKAPLLQELKLADELKVIVFNSSDFKWAEENAKKASAHCSLFLQPEWNVSKKMLPSIIEYCKKNPSWRISLQTHKWMDVR